MHLSQMTVGYPLIIQPENSSMSLIATYRDDNIVNLPCNLLVEEDVIILGPGRKTPVRCKQVRLT